MDDDSDVDEKKLNSSMRRKTKSNYEDSLKRFILGFKNTTFPTINELKRSFLKEL